MQQVQQPTRAFNFKPILTTLGVLIVVVALVNWGGTAKPGPLFVVGVGVLTGLLAFLGAAIWYLFASPLPAKTRVLEQRSSLVARSLAGVLAVSSGLMFSVALVWDETWHHRYGGFGNDFLWSPHFLLYGSLGILAFFASAGMLFLALKGSGGIRERFRAEPLIGLVGLIALFQTAAAPSDLLWHKIYGVDLTAWSLPHLMLFGGVSCVMLCAVPLTLSSVPTANWRGLNGLKLQEMLAIALLGFAGTLFVILLAAEWEGISSLPDFTSGNLRAFWQRPEWLYPVVLMTIGGFIGSIAQNALKRVGVSSLVGVLIVLHRLITVAIFGGGEEGLSANSQLMVLPVFVLLDLWQASRLTRKLRPAWSARGALIVAAASLLVILPIIPNVLIYPRINANTLPMMIVMSLIMMLGSSWLGSNLGTWLASLGNRPTALEQPSKTSNWVAVAGVMMAVALVFAAIVTAKPPTI
jgi:hypothetical protein